MTRHHASQICCVNTKECRSRAPTSRFLSSALMQVCPLPLVHEPQHRSSACCICFMSIARQGSRCSRGAFDPLQPGAPWGSMELHGAPVDIPFVHAHARLRVLRAVCVTQKANRAQLHSMQAVLALPSPVARLCSTRLGLCGSRSLVVPGLSCHFTCLTFYICLYSRGASLLNEAGGCGGAAEDPGRGCCCPFGRCLRR